MRNDERSDDLRRRITTRKSQDEVFIPFHFREASTNPFTFDELDPTGMIPRFEYCAVRVTRATT
jgi:formate dehydrogenase major subunit